MGIHIHIYIYIYLYIDLWDVVCKSPYTQQLGIGCLVVVVVGKGWVKCMMIGYLDP